MSGRGVVGRRGADFSNEFWDENAFRLSLISKLTPKFTLRLEMRQHLMYQRIYQRDLSKRL